MKSLLSKLLGVCLFLMSLHSNAISISVNPTSQNVYIGSMVSVSLDISGLVDDAAPSLGAFDFDVGFDPSILTFVDVAFGNQLDILGLGSIQAVTSAPGTINLFELSLDSASDLDLMQAGNFSLITLHFDTLIVGTSSLSITVNALGDSMGDSLLASVQDGSVTVAAIPEPSTALLISVGGLILLGKSLHRRPRSIQQAAVAT